MVGSGALLAPTSPRQLDPGVAFGERAARLRGPEWAQLPLLTCGSFGYQIVWSMEMAFASPYLVELGLSKSQTAAVLSAGPISGLLVQPIIGVVADASTHPWGRRRPPLLAACLLSVASMFMFAFSKNVGRMFASGAAGETHWTAQACAIISVWCIDFSVNAIMSLDRSLFVDMVSPSEQGHVSAWAARLAGLGDVLGFLVSHWDMPRHAPFSWFPGLAEASKAGSNEGQLKCLCFVTSFVLLGTHIVTAWTAQERPLVRTAGHRPGLQDVLENLKDMVADFFTTARSLPAPFLWVFAVQFFSWIGWFPIMFYSTLWIGSIWSMTQTEGGDDAAKATRYGAGALFYRAILGFVFSIVAPTLVRGGADGGDGVSLPLQPSGTQSGLSVRGKTLEQADLWCFSTFVFAVVLFSTLWAELARSAGLAWFLLVISGACWAITMWVPYSLIGTLVANDREGPASSSGATASNGAIFDAEREAFLASGDADDDAARENANGTYGAGSSSVRSEGNLHERAGTILGLLNVSIVIPQLISTVLSSILFAIKDSRVAGHPGDAPPAVMRSSTAASPGKARQDAAAIGLTFRVGGLSAVFAGYLALQLIRRHRQDLIPRT